VLNAPAALSATGTGPAGQAEKGVLKRVCVPNSWAGDYSRYAHWLARAQEFFEAASPDTSPRR